MEFYLWLSVIKQLETTYQKSKTVFHHLSKIEQQNFYKEYEGSNWYVDM